MKRESMNLKRKTSLQFSCMQFSSLINRLNANIFIHNLYKTIIKIIITFNLKYSILEC